MKKAQEKFALLAPRDAQGILVEWFRTLRFRHSAKTHLLLLASLNWLEMRELFYLAAPGGNFDAFAIGILHEALLAYESGKVVPSGLPRRKGGGRKRKIPEVRP